MTYRYCECDNASETYKSFGGEICCSKCFTVMPAPQAQKIKKDIIGFIEDDHNYCVQRNGITVKHFNKFEDDYAYTNSRKFAAKLNLSIPIN